MKTESLHQARLEEHMARRRLHDLGIIAMSEHEREQFASPALLRSMAIQSAVISALRSPSFTLPPEMSLSPRELGSDGRYEVGTMIRGAIVPLGEL